MSANVENIGSLAAENESLKARLEEAEELLRAIRSGEVDALVVGEQIFSLESSDAASSRFRGEVLSQVTEAVIATDNDGRIIYINDAAEGSTVSIPERCSDHCRTKLFICGGLAKPTAELPKMPCGKRVTGVARIYT